jgi:hypothetical protein
VVELVLSVVEPVETPVVELVLSVVEPVEIPVTGGRN